jgi:hypothetical protein
MSEPTGKCEVCGEPMPAGEEMFKYHGYSGDCPKPPLPRPVKPTYEQLEQQLARMVEILKDAEQALIQARTLKGLQLRIKSVLSFATPSTWLADKILAAKKEALE